jgi:hypothetical protein
MKTATGGALGLLSGAILAGLIGPHFGQFANAQTPQLCTESSTPVQCFTAGLAQIGTARAEFQRIQSDLTVRIAALETRMAGDRSKLEELSRIAAPSGGVLAFDLPQCPEGWSKYELAVGRFIRGLDPNVGERRIGSTQEDAFQGFTFGEGEKRLRFSRTMTTSDAPNGYSSMQSTGIYGANPAFGSTVDVAFITDGKNGDPRVADETRPKNVGLLYCKRK